MVSVQKLCCCLWDCLQSKYQQSSVKKSCICIRPCHTLTDFALYWTRWSLYHTEWKSKIIAKSLCTVWQSNSAHAAWVKRLTQAAWAELDCQTVQSDLAIILDFHSVWYRDHLVQYRAKSVRVWQGLIHMHDFFTELCWYFDWRQSHKQQQSFCTETKKWICFYFKKSK